MELLHLLSDRLFSFFTPLLQCSLKQNFSHHHSNNISTVVIPFIHKLH